MGFEESLGSLFKTPGLDGDFRGELRRPVEGNGDDVLLGTSTRMTLSTAKGFMEMDMSDERMRSESVGMLFAQYLQSVKQHPRFSGIELIQLGDDVAVNESGDIVDFAADDFDGDRVFTVDNLTEFVTK